MEPQNIDGWRSIVESLQKYEAFEEFYWAEMRRVDREAVARLSASGAGTKEGNYSVLPGKAVALTPEEIEEFRAKKPIDESSQG